MKLTRMFGLAILGALISSGSVASSSAMAEGPTALCASEQVPCSSPVTHVHDVSVGKAKIKSSLPTIECNVLFLGDALNSGLESPLIIHGRFSYSSCNNFCTLKEEVPSAEVWILKTANELTSVTFERLLNYKCPFINCNYVGTGLEGHGLGPLTSSQANGSVVITEQLVEKENGSCPEESFLTITTTPLSATYISS